MALTTIPAANAKLRATVLNSLITELRPLEIRLSSNVALATGTTALANVAGLVLAVAANCTYDGYLLAASSLAAGVAEDIKYAFTFPAGATLDFGTVGAAFNLAAAATSGDGEWVYFPSATSGSSATVFGVTTAVNTNMIPFRLTVSSTAGNLQVQAAQFASGANVVTIRAGTKLCMRRVA